MLPTIPESMRMRECGAGELELVGKCVLTVKCALREGKGRSECTDLRICVKVRLCVRGVRGDGCAVCYASL